MENLNFHLQDNEKVILTLKPKKMFILQNIILGAFGYSFLFIFLLGFSTIFSKSVNVFTLFLFGSVICAILLLSVFSAYMRYRKENYWITNQRVIFKRGFFGYVITSLPLERIVDVVISRSLYQQILKIPSLHLDTFGSGAVGNTNTLGTMFAVDKPEDLQKLILELVKKKRKVEKLSM